MACSNVTANSSAMKAGLVMGISSLQFGEEHSFVHFFSLSV